MHSFKRRAETLERPSERAIGATIFVVGLALLATRRPDAILTPQFYFEDGPLLFEAAHEHGALWTIFDSTIRGYLLVVSRLGASIATLFPLRWAPLVMALIALAIQTLPAVLLSSNRLAHLLPRRWQRLLAALFFLALPHTWTTMGNLIHAPFYLGILATVMLVAEPPQRWGWRVFDVAMLVLLGLSGPFALLIAPAFALKWLVRRSQPWIFVQAGLCGCGALVEVVSIVLTRGDTGGAVGYAASVSGPFVILGRQVALGLFAGQSLTERLIEGGNVLAGSTVCLLLGLLASAVFAYGVIRGPLELRLLTLVALLVFVATLVSPPIAAPSWWKDLEGPSYAPRYFAIPMLALAATLVRLAVESRRALWLPAVVLLVLSAVVAIPLDWRQPPLRDYGFPAYVDRYERATPGQKIAIPHPPGWTTMLTRR